MKKDLSLIILPIIISVFAGSAMASSCMQAGNWTSKKTKVMKDHYYECGGYHCTVNKTRKGYSATVKKYLYVPVAELAAPRHKGGSSVDARNACVAAYSNAKN